MLRVPLPRVVADGETWPYYHRGDPRIVRELQDVRPGQPVSDRVRGLTVRAGVQFPPLETFARLWPDCDRVWVIGVPEDNRDEFFANLQACAQRLVLLTLQVLPPPWFTVRPECWLQLVAVPDVMAVDSAFGSAHFQVWQCHGVTAVALGPDAGDVRIVGCDALETADIAAAQLVDVSLCPRLRRLVLQAPFLLHLDLCDALERLEMGEIPAGGTVSVGRCASLMFIDPGPQPLRDLHCDVGFPLHANVAEDRLDANNAFFLAHAHYDTDTAFDVPGPLVAAQRRLALNSRRNLLLMAMAGRRRRPRFGRLPPELWQLIFDEFLCDGMIFVFP